MSQQDEQDSSGKNPAESEKPAQSKRASALDDLTGGLDLMLSAAKKALRGIEPRQVEELGRRVKQSLGQVEPGTVRDLGRRAAQSLDPKHIEDIANQAGRELLGVVERVTERIETALGHGKARTTPPPANQPPANQPPANQPPANQPPAEPTPVPSEGSDPGRVRVES